MGIEERLGTKGWNKLVGTTRIVLGVAMIGYGAMDAGLIKTPHIKVLQQIVQQDTTPEYTIQRESSYESIKRNRKNKKSLSDTFFPNNKSLQSNNSRSNMPPKELLDAADRGGEIFEDSIPYIIMIGGILSLVSGAGYLRNPNYKR